GFGESQTYLLRRCRNRSAHQRNRFAQESVRKRGGGRHAYRPYSRETQKQTAQFSVTQQWAANSIGKNVIEIEMQLSDNADILATGLCRGDDRLDAELHGLPGPVIPGLIVPTVFSP